MFWEASDTEAAECGGCTEDRCYVKMSAPSFPMMQSQRYVCNSLLCWYTDKRRQHYRNYVLIPRSRDAEIVGIPIFALADRYVDCFFMSNQTKNDDKMFKLTAQSEHIQPLQNGIKEG